VSGALTLKIDALVLETELERDASEQLGPVLQQALQQLAAALRRLPGGQLERLDALVLDRLELELSDPRQLLGPAGPDLLAEQLLARLLARTGETR
jgi:hypothetical protein